MVGFNFLLSILCFSIFHHGKKEISTGKFYTFGYFVSPKLP